MKTIILKFKKGQEFNEGDNLFYHIKFPVKYNEEDDMDDNVIALEDFEIIIRNPIKRKKKCTK